MIRTLLIAATVSAVAVPASAGLYHDGPRHARVEVGVFAELDYYGRWVNVNAYGTVWQPYAAPGWRPYAHGHWVWSDYGWTWVSYEPFGWATYHYGNWTWDPRLGWLWIPGYDWAPCRVEWLVVDGYVCWAPLPPPGYRVVRPWSRGWLDVWITVGARHFTDPYVGRHRVRTVDFKSNHDRSATRYKAPDVRTIERFKGKPVARVDVDLERRRVGKREIKRMELPRAQKQIVERHRVEHPRVKKPTRGRTHPRVKGTTRDRNIPRAKSPTRERDRSRAKDSNRERDRPRVKDSNRERDDARVKKPSRDDRRDVKRPKKETKKRKPRGKRR